MKMKMLIAKLTRRAATVAAIGALVAAMGGTWSAASAAPPALVASAQPAPSPSSSPRAAPDGEPHVTKKSSHKELTGKLNLNTATEDQLMMLPTVGPAKAERIVAWRKKNGAFKRTADLRHVKGFGYRTFKKLEPYLDIKGDTTLEPK
jgi:competence protein ComEA